MSRIYLDHNATTPLDPLVAEAMIRVLRGSSANPASQHESGRQARRMLETARETITELVGADPDDRVFFTSGGTEANNWALRGLMSPGGALITSEIEHPSIIETANALAHEGHRVLRLPSKTDGTVDVAPLQDWLESGIQLLSVMWANNETGVLQPIESIVQSCSAFGVQVHTDAVQVAGKLPLNFRKLGVAAMSITAHKFHGPLGIGALVVHRNTRIRPLLYGGFQQSGLRPGTESVALAVGMCKALEQWKSEAAERHARMQRLRDLFESTIIAELPFAAIIGQSASRLPHTSNIAFVGCDRQPLIMALDLRGIDCSTGSACASGSSEPSHVLKAMKLQPEVINSSIRFSLGAFTNEAEIEDAARRVIMVVQQRRQQS